MTKSTSVFTASLVAMGLIAAPAAAFEIVNDEVEPAKVIVEQWVQVVSAGKTARFRPFENPTLLKIELSHIRLQCEAGENDHVRLANNNCYVNGDLAGEGQFRM
jgi:hypothetical protein